MTVNSDTSNTDGSKSIALHLQGLDSKRDSILDEALKKYASGQLVFLYEKEAYILITSSLRQRITYEVGHIDLEDFNSHAWLNNLDIKQFLISCGTYLVQKGIQHRNSAVCQADSTIVEPIKLQLALQAYRFGLQVCLRYQHIQGIDTIAQNLYQLAGDIQSQRIGRQMPFNWTRQIKPEALAKFGEPYAKLSQQINKLSAELQASLWNVVESLDQEQKDYFLALNAYRRLITLTCLGQPFSRQFFVPDSGGVVGKGPESGNIEGRQLVSKLWDLTQSKPSLKPYVLVAVYEGLTTIYLSEIMIEMGVTTLFPSGSSTDDSLSPKQRTVFYHYFLNVGITPDEHKLPLLDLTKVVYMQDVRGKLNIPEVEDTGFEELWSLYDECRKVISLSEHRDFLYESCFNAVKHFEKLRSFCMHSDSENIGRVVAGVAAVREALLCRDFASILLASNVHDRALEIAEQSKGGHFSNSMATRHSFTPEQINCRIGFPRNTIGDLNLLDIRDIAHVAQTQRSHILHYFHLSDTTYMLFVTYSNGVVECHELGNVLRETFLLTTYFPYAELLFPFAANFGFDGDGSLLVKSSQKHDLGKNKEALNNTLAALGKRLIPDRVLEQFSKLDCKSLKIITDGHLSYVPFACLKPDSERYLVEDFDITYWPSVTAWNVAKTSFNARTQNDFRRSQSIVLGDPNYATHYIPINGNPGKKVKFGKLPGTGKEAIDVSRLLETEPLLEDNASLNRVLGILSHNRHFASKEKSYTPVMHLATHAVSIPKRGGDNFIVLSGQDLLTADDVYSFPFIFRCLLVTLSACQTASDAVNPGSNLGLTNSFLINGATSVCSTLWSISDSSTATLMSTFYRNICQKHLNLPQSLAEAQREMIERHPYYWAAFKVTGYEGNPVCP